MYTPLNIKTSYSLLESTIDIKKLIHKAKESSFSALGISDISVLSAVPSFKNECLKNGIKPIIGLEVSLNYDEFIYPVSLIAKNDSGYLNLVKLSSYINTTNNVLDVTTFKSYLKDCFLIFTSTLMPGQKYIDSEDTLRIKETLLELRKQFGEYYIGLNSNEIEYYRLKNNNLKNITKSLDIKTIVFNEIRYLEREEYRAYAVLKCIKEKTVIEDINTISNEGLYFKTCERINEIYDEEDISNLEVLVNNCNVKFNYPKTTLPTYPLKDGVASKDYLISLCKEGLRIRLKNNISDIYKQRLAYELKIIVEMHFEDYFLIVYDFIKFAKKNDIYVGPGRGSAAGSLVAYTLGITDIDPIKYGLYFERFLNPERVSMPDIDTDFPDDKRDEVIEYVSKKYGPEHVAHILTFGTLKAKQVLRDVARVLGIRVEEVDRLSKSIPNELNITLEDAYNSSKLFKELINAKKEYQMLYSLSKSLEGLPRHCSTHAAGIVMSKLNLTDVVPLISIENDLYSSQFQMEYLEDLGLIKMDFLSLRNLSIIKEVVDDIKKAGVNIDIRNIPLDDQRTLKLIRDLDVLGVFQLESAGMMNTLRKVKPTRFEDVATTIALFRPGPMDNIPLYIENRANPANIKYPHKNLEHILKETSGIIVYQEQIMEIARIMAGFSLGKADVLRRAMSKKKKEILDSLKNEFVEGCLKNGYDNKTANEVYELIFKFANYGFNKSHSIAYGVVAYQMAYLKANYPLFFYKALFNGLIGAEVKTYETILECNKRHIKLLKPSINNSGDIFVIKDNSLLPPLTIIKNIGYSVCNAVLSSRLEKGVFKNYYEAVYRLTKAGVNTRSIESLIKAGAFDDFNLTRKTMLVNLKKVIDSVAFVDLDQVTITGETSDLPLIDKYAEDKGELAEGEKEVFGYYFTVHPIEDFKEANGIKTLNLSELTTLRGNVEGFGVINRIREHRAKTGDLMCFVSISDETSDFDLVVMPRLYAEFQKTLAKGKLIHFFGKIDREGSALVNKMRLY